MYLMTFADDLAFQNLQGRTTILPRSIRPEWTAPARKLLWWGEPPWTSLIGALIGRNIEMRLASRRYASLGDFIASHCGCRLLTHVAQDDRPG
jgi:hypothetical protein